MRHLFNYQIYLVLMLLVFSNLAYSSTYIRDYKYKASEADSKLTCRTIAIDQLKNILLQEIGTNVRQRITVTKDGNGATYASEDVEAITAGLTKLEIIEEKWDGESYYVKAKLTADTDQVLSSIQQFKDSDSKENEELLYTIKKKNEALKNARSELDKLKEELKSTKNKDELNKLSNRYNSNVNNIAYGNTYCVFPDSPGVLAPNWICGIDNPSDIHMAGVVLTSVGVAVYNADDEAMKISAATYGREQLRGKFRDYILKQLLANNIVHSESNLDIFLGSHEIIGIMIYKARTSPSGTKYVLLGLKQSAIDKYIDMYLTWTKTI